MSNKRNDDLIELIDYIKNFNIHFSLLIRRYERFKQINKMGNKDIDVITYFDMIVVQLRALCIENERNMKNYTAQILLRKVGEEELAKKIDDMLALNFFCGSSELNIKQALKTLADKFICHYDNFDGDIHKLSLADILMKRLCNPYEKVNLDFIMKVLVECIGDGLRIKG